LSQIFTFFLYLSWSRASIYPDTHLMLIIPPDVPLRLDGADAPDALMLSFDVLDLPRRF
jgi:hypothetical protein